VAGNENESGDIVQKLDIYANEKIIDCLKNSGDCCGIASEENEEIIPLKGVASKDSKYVVLFDPLDGSSNIDVNVSVGTILVFIKGSAQ
jgi:fructose-1,6-bisphosphatase I